MTSDQQDFTSIMTRATAWWHAVRDGYRRLDAGTHRMLGILLKVCVIGYFLGCAGYLTVRHLVWPRVENYKTEIEQAASKAIGKPVSVSVLRASWDGFNPRLILDEVVMRDESGKKMLSFPRISATLSWWTIPVVDLRFKQLEITRPELDIRRDAKGNIHIAGMLFDSAAEGDNDGAQWALSQEAIVIREGRIRWRDEMRQAPELALEDVQIVLQNGWWSHRLMLTAKPPASLAAPMEIRADFRHPLFVSDISDVRQWKGELYADLQNTNLIAWKPYFDYPFEVNKGFGSVRTWVTIDHERIADFTADLSLKDVTTRLRDDLEPLNLIEISGRISAREYGSTIEGSKKKSLFGATGHSVELTNVTLKTKEGLVLPETTISEEHQPGLYGEPGRTSIYTKQVDLETITKFIKYIPMTADQRKILVDLSPRGQLKDFWLQWEGDYPDLLTYRVSGEFAGLSFKEQPSRIAKAVSRKKTGQIPLPGIPGFENLTGRVHANQLGGNIELDSEKLVLNFPGIFKESAMNFDSLKMQASWAYQEKRKEFEFEISKANFVQEGIEGSLSGKHIRPLNLQDKSAGFLSLTGTLSGFDVKRIGRYLPLQTPDGLRKWLTGGLEEGFARNVQFKVKGNLADFPFPERAKGRQNGEFIVTAGIENGKLNYTPGNFAKDGVSPMWPQAEKIQGRISVRGAQMEIWADTAETANVALTDVSAVIPDMLSKDMKVEILGHATGALQDFLHYTKMTPVAEWIGNFTEDTKGSGNARLHLKMQLALDRIKESKVQGTVQFENNNVKLLKTLPQLSNTQGKFEFFEKGFRLHDISAEFLGGLATISGGTQGDGKFRINARGNLTLDGVRKEYPGIPYRIKGKTDYSVAITESGRQPDIEVESDLRGVAFDFPVPLRKAANDELSLKVIMTDQTPQSGHKFRDQIDIALGKAILARYQRQRAATKGAPWEIVRGGIGIHAPAPEPAAGVKMRMVMGPINVDTWKSAISAVASSKVTKAPEASSDADMMQNFLPTVFSIKTPKLMTSGFQFDKVELDVERRKDSLQVGIKSLQATGDINLSEDAKRGQSKIVARLSELNIASSLVPKTSELLEASDKPAQLPDLDIVAQNFEIYGKKLGLLELVASNVPASAGRQWNIDKLVIDNPSATMSASGKWTAIKSANKTSMKYAMKMKDAGKLLDRVGFTGVLRDGEGNMDGILEWEGTPFALDKPSLSGNIALTMKKGQFLQSEPGVAKLLNVLNLQSLPRRLKLDFRDVFSKGFAFDRVTATADISKGVLKTDNLKMRGVGATVLMEGTADIAKETQDLHVVVIPEFDASAATIAVLIVNPAIGVGTFLAQLFLKDPLMKAMTYEYHVTGTWDEPAITKIKKKEDESENSSFMNNTKNNEGA